MPFSISIFWCLCQLVYTRAYSQSTTAAAKRRLLSLILSLRKPQVSNTWLCSNKKRKRALLQLLLRVYNSPFDSISIKDLRIATTLHLSIGTHQPNPEYPSARNCRKRKSRISSHSRQVLGRARLGIQIRGVDM